jgi:hypothetical protein
VHFPMGIVEQEENGENEIKGSEPGNNCDSDPLVYQLVRVKFEHLYLILTSRYVYLECKIIWALFCSVSHSMTSVL